MAEATSPSEIAERVSRRRTRIMYVQAMIFVIWQATFFGWLSPVADPLRRVDQVKLGAWLVWALALLLLLATPPGWFQKREVKRLLDDEVSRANRAAALGVGFWVGALTGIALFLLTLFVEMETLQTLHLVLSASIGAAVLRFAALERRAERAG